MRKFSLFIIIMTLLVQNVVAQDAHYWTEQYGTKSMLLSNSVVGSVSDLGAVFYNPARLGQIEKPAFVISAKVYQLSNTNFENGAGDDIDLKKSKFGGAPSLVAGTFKIKWLPEHKFAYAFLTRYTSDINFSTRSQVYGDVIESLPGEEYFSGRIELNKKVKEEWMGVSWSKSLSEKLSIGVSTFITAREQSSLIESNLQAYPEDERLEMFTQKNSYSYDQFGLLWKIGLSYQLKRMTAGITVTTPNLRLFGEGDMQYEYFSTAYESNSSVYELDTQDGLEAIHKTPWSVAVGAGFNILKGTFHVSSEYFSAVDRHTIMQSEPFTGQSTGEEKYGQLVNRLNSVFNFGVGYNINVNEKVGAYVSYSTDFSAAIPNSYGIDPREDLVYIGSTFRSDISHFGAGVILDLSWADLTLGATNASAKYAIKRPIDFPNDDASVASVDEQESQIDWSRWRFIVGISVPLFKQMADKLNL
ncbi:hypothetical protein [Carboxylicivirga marina]|uniref:hypothetical protein n=1 Tax=Carboxylicivirga marina TaxID=2800988 RepID=UPI002594D298|nr:hypothetical protein [uncultured Carboxylicivirga sp.]